MSGHGRTFAEQGLSRGTLRSSEPPIEEARVSAHLAVKALHGEPVVAHPSADGANVAPEVGGDGLGAGEDQGVAPSRAGRVCRRGPMGATPTAAR